MKKKKGEMNFDEAMKFYARKIERGETVRNGGFLYKDLKV